MSGGARPKVRHRGSILGVRRPWPGRSALMRQPARKRAPKGVGRANPRFERCRSRCGPKGVPSRARLDCLQTFPLGVLAKLGGGLSEARARLDAPCRGTVRALHWRENDSARRRVSPNFRGAANRCWDDPIQDDCAEHAPSIAWQEVAQNI